MSWDGYIDSVIGGTGGACDKVAILGLTGGGLWTSGTHGCNFPVTTQEGVDIAKAMINDDMGTFQAKGIFIAGEKYQYLRYDTDEGIALGKKKDKGSVTIHKSNSAIIVAHTIEGKSQGETNKGVEAIIKYLKESNM